MSNGYVNNPWHGILKIKLYKPTSLSNQGCKRRPNLKQKILHDERIFFYKDDLVLAHMGANSRRALILSNCFLGGR